MIDLTGVASHFRSKAKNTRYKNDPAAWIEDRLGLFLWSKQREIMDALKVHKNVAVKSTFSTGKTLIAAAAAAWWAETQGDKSMVVTTAPTFRQVNSVLWEYLRRFHAEFNLKGEILQQPKWNAVDKHGAKVIAGLGVKPSDGNSANSTEMSALQGLHPDDGMLAVIDEAAGVSKAIFSGLQRITTGPKDRILALCNPTDASSHMAQLFRDRPEDWHFITISAFDTPNFTGESVPPDLAASMPDPYWVELRRKEWGEDSSRWKSEILAEFTDSSADGLFNMSIVNESINDVSKEPNLADAPRFGVDVGHLGEDSTVVVKYHSGQVTVVDQWQGEDTQYSGRRILELASDHGVDEIRIDAVGVGAGVYDYLLYHGHDRLAVWRMMGNMSSPDFERWYNARAWWYDDLRQKLADSLIDLPDVKGLFDQFALIRYEIRGTSMLIESKEQMRRRGVKSPDILDAIVYAVADVESTDAGFAGGYVAIDDILDEDDDELDYVIAPF